MKKGGSFTSIIAHPSNAFDATHADDVSQSVCPTLLGVRASAGVTAFDLSGSYVRHGNDRHLIQSVPRALSVAFHRSIIRAYRSNQGRGTTATYSPVRPERSGIRSPANSGACRACRRMTINSIRRAGSACRPWKKQVCQCWERNVRRSYLGSRRAQAVQHRQRLASPVRRSLLHAGELGETVPRRLSVLQPNISETG